jgi:isopenicillin N synthase-like dioxygenase
MKTIDLESIDISSFFDRSGKKSVASTVDAACQKRGIFAALGHGISQNLLENCTEAARRFFSQPSSLKESIPIASLIPPRGYFPHGVYVTKSPENPKVIEVRENFVFCLPPAAQAGSPSGQDSEFFKSVTWPESVPGFKESFIELNEAMGTLSRKLWSIFAHGLGLPDEYFSALTTKPISFTVLNYYKHVEKWTPDYGNLRMGAHTDITTFTLLTAEASKDGFQIELEPEEWAAIRAAPDSVIVQIGDLMRIWTNARWTAPRHRVVPPAPSQLDNSRISIVFGVQPDYDAEISCLATCKSSENPAKYQPTTCSQYEKAAFERAVRALRSR